MALVETKLDASKLKNEVTQVYNEAFKGLNAKSDNERRDILNALVEKLKTLKSRVDEL